MQLTGKISLRLDSSSSLLLDYGRKCLSQGHHDALAAATCHYLSNFSKVEAISLSILPKNTTGELYRLVSTLSL